MLINTDSKTKKSILAAMTLAEYESLTTAEKTVIELSQYAEAEAYSILGDRQTRWPYCWNGTRTSRRNGERITRR